MKITKKLIKIAQSLGIIIDKPIRQKLGLKEGDYVEMNIFGIDIRRKNERTNDRKKS